MRTFWRKHRCLSVQANSTAGTGLRRTADVFICIVLHIVCNHYEVPTHRLHPCIPICVKQSLNPGPWTDVPVGAAATPPPARGIFARQFIPRLPLQRLGPKRRAANDTVVHLFSKRWQNIYNSSFSPVVSSCGSVSGFVSGFRGVLCLCLSLSDIEIEKFPLGETFFFLNVQICASCLTKRSPWRLFKPLVYLLDREHPRYVVDCHLWPVWPRQPIRRPELMTLLAHLVSAISLTCIDVPRTNLVLPFVKTFIERMQCSAP